MVFLVENKASIFPTMNARLQTIHALGMKGRFYN